MTFEDRVATIFARANPVPSLDLLDPIEPIGIDGLEELSERSIAMVEIETKDRDVRRRFRMTRLAWAGLALTLVALGVVVFLTPGEPPIAATPVDHATAFWLAMVEGDRDFALSELDPTATPSEMNLFGRAHALAGQFDWYEAVDWHWDLDVCTRVEDRSVECVVSATNAWSDAIGLGPVVGTYVLEFSEQGIVGIIDKANGFADRWGSQVFTPFAEWVQENHPSEASVMFAFENDVTPQILDLYEVNTQRFVEAISG